MQIKWAALAFVRLTLCYIIGILFYQFFEDAYITVLFILLGSSLAYSLLLFFTKKIAKRKLSLAFSALAFIIVVSAAYTNSANQHESKKHLFYQALETDIQAYTAVVEKPPIEKNNGYSVLLNVQRIKQNNTWRETYGKINAYLPYKENIPHLNEILLIKGTPSAYSAPLNPGEFDYSKFMHQQGIYLQHYIPKDKSKYLGKAEDNFFTYAYFLRGYFTEHFKKYIKGKDEQAIALALVIGVKDQLDHEIKSAYSGAGAMHVLAVSGLHVGIIFKILGLLFIGFKKRKYGRWIYGITSGVVLWFYAAITGFSPSVVRASTMFTFVLIALIINRKSSIYNTLAASAFCMLVYNPNYLFQVGFQLSYFAVFGIVYLFPKIYNIIEVKNYFLDLLWTVSVVSIAAQIATFPLGLFYFHQFPVYFLFANPFVILAATVVVTVGILFPITGFMPTIIPTFIGNVIHYLLYFTNQVIFYINQLPFAKTHPVYFSTSEVIFIYAAIITLVLFFTLKKLKYLSTAVLCIFLLSASSIYEQIKPNQQLLTVYAVKNHSCVSVVYNHEAYVLVDDALSKNKKKIAYHIGNHLLKKGIDHYETFPFSSLNKLPFPLKKQGGNYFFVINGKRIGVLKDNTKTPEESLDLAICTQNAFKKHHELSRIQATNIIFDSSNTAYLINKIKSKVEKGKKDTQYYNTFIDGAYQFNLTAK